MKQNRIVNSPLPHDCIVWFIAKAIINQKIFLSLHYESFMQNAPHISSQKELFASDFSQKRTGDYSFGMNGMEKDDEIFGSTGTSYTAQFWQYDSRLGRRWNLDPKGNPSISFYATFADNPIWFSDPFGDIGVYKHRKYTVSAGNKGNVTYKFGRKGKSLSQMSKKFQASFNKEVNPIYQAMSKSTTGRQDIEFISSSKDKFNLSIDFDSEKKEAFSNIWFERTIYNIKGTYYITPLEKSLQKSSLPYDMAMATTIDLELNPQRRGDVEKAKKLSKSQYKLIQTPGTPEYIKYYSPLIKKSTKFNIEYNKENKLGIPLKILQAPLERLKEPETPRERLIRIGKI